MNETNSDAPLSLACSNMTTELSGIRAYNNFVDHAWEGDWNGTAMATALFVGAHNLVSITLGDHFVRTERKIYCVEDILRLLPREYVQGIPDASKLSVSLPGFPKLRPGCAQ